MIHPAMQTTFFIPGNYPGGRAAPIAPGLQARNQGAARVLEHAGDGWQSDIRRVIYDLASRRLEFTSDDVRAEAQQAGIPEPHHPNAYGAALLAAAHAGLIIDTGRVARSERPEARGRKVAVWVPWQAGGAA